MDSGPILVVAGPAGAGKTTIGRELAARFEASVLLPVDSFMTYVVNGWVDPWLPAADAQNDALGAAVTAAAIVFARAGYTVIVDGPLFPHGIRGMQDMCEPRGVELHYAVLRPAPAECRERLRRRGGDAAVHHAFDQLYDRYEDLGDFAGHVFDNADDPATTSSAVLSAFEAGRLKVT